MTVVRSILPIPFWIGAFLGLAFTAYLAWVAISIGGFLEVAGIVSIVCLAASAIALEHAVRTEIYGRRLTFLALIMVIALAQFAVIVWTA